MSSFLSEASESIRARMAPDPRLASDLIEMVREALIHNISRLSMRELTGEQINKMVGPGLNSRRERMNEYTGMEVLKPKANLFELLEIRQEIQDEFTDSMWFRQIAHNGMTPAESLEVDDVARHCRIIFLAFYREGFNPFFFDHSISFKAYGTKSSFAKGTWTREQVSEHISLCTEYPRVMRTAFEAVGCDRNALRKLGAICSGKYKRGKASVPTMVDVSVKDLPHVRNIYKRSLRNTGDKNLSALASTISLYSFQKSKGLARVDGSKYIKNDAESLGYNIDSVLGYYKDHPDSRIQFAHFIEAINAGIPIELLYRLTKSSTKYGSSSLDTLYSNIEKMKSTGLSAEEFAQTSSSWVESWNN